MLAVGELKKVLQDHPEAELETIEIGSNLGRSWKAGIRLFPALKIGDDILSGVLLSKEKIRTFIEKHR